MFIRLFKPEFLTEFVSETVINILWPIGLLISYAPKAFDKKDKTERAGN